MADEGQAATQPSVDDQAMSIMANIIKQEEEGTPQEAQVEKPTEEPQTEETEAEAQPAEETQDEEKPAEAEEESQQPEWDWETVQSLKRKFTVKAEDGSDQEVELTPEEVQKGIMLERAFRQKTAQLARERESVSQKIREAVEPKLKEYDERLQQAEQVLLETLAPELQGVDLNRLAVEDPAAWAQKYQRINDANTRLQRVQSERQRIAEERQKEAQVLLRKQAEESVEVLKTEIPDWNNDLYGKILKSGVELYGFKPDEVNAITDHRAIKVLHDAMMYRALKAKPIVEKRTPVKTPKVVKPGTTERPSASADQWKKSMARLQKTGKDDAAFEMAKIILASEGKK